MSEWIAVGLSIIVNIFSVLDVLLVIKLFFGVDIPLRYYWRIGAVFGGFNLFFELFFWKYTWIMFGLVLIYIVLVEFYFIKKRRWRILLFTIAALCVYAQYEMLVSSILEYTGIVQYDVLLGEISLFSVLTTIFIFLILAVVLYILERKHPLVPLGTGGMIFISVFSFLSPALLSLLGFVEESIQNERFSLICFVFMFLLNAAVIYGIFHNQNAKFYQNVSQNYKEQFNSEYQYFQGYKEEQQDMASFRHDWKNHMLLLQSMFERKEYEKAEAYFADLSRQRLQGSYQALSGNEIIDMILYAKSEQIADTDIRLSCDGSLSILNFMEPVDCCILFANLIDNAIEANISYQGDRYITIQGVRHPGTIMIRIENPTAQEISRKGEVLISTKPDSLQHGIGSRNAFEIIHKYAGEYTITNQENLFAIQIVFPLEASV